jgi:shikimate dehydrogenase
MTHPDRFLMAGVMGWPVMHSRSPMLHNYWFQRQKLIGTYLPLANRPEDLAAALRPLGFAGRNLTIPYKQAAIRLVATGNPNL